jgi:hypothetical protein
MAARFPILADEHVPRALVQALLSRGWLVVRVVDLVGELGQGADDEAVFSYASQQGYVVLSSDVRALWRSTRYWAEGQSFLGMVCWPQRHRDQMSLGDAIEALERLTLEEDPFVAGFRFLQPPG